MNNKLSPSILSADFAALGEQLAKIERSGAHYVHIDVMDGHFVPNITIGPLVIKSLRKRSKLIFDVHLMIENPWKYVQDFAEAGADIINFHIEAVKNPEALIDVIKRCGKQAAVTIKPETEIDAILPLINRVGMILIMSVNPGFGGQGLIPEALNKARRLRAYMRENNLSVDIEMDGGINLQNVKTVLDSGVNVIVAGSAIFGGEKSIEENTREFLRIMGR